MNRIVKAFQFGAILMIAALTLAQTQKKPAAPAQKSPAPAQSQKTPPPQAEPADDEATPPDTPGALFPAVVARVNGKAIPGRDLEQRVQSELATIGSPQWNNLKEDYRQQLTRESLAAVIATELVYQKALAGGVKVTDADVQSEFDKTAKTFGSDAQMNAALASRGTDRAGLRKDIRRTLVVGKFVQENVAPKVSVTPVEVSQYYAAHPDEFRHGDMVRTSHILILVPEKATAEQDAAAKQRAQAIFGRLKKGEDFAKLAKENSMDPSASQGGDIGYTQKGQLAPEYEEAAYKNAVGSISEPVRTQYGYHIIKVTERKKEGLATLDEVRAQLTEFLKGQKAEEELNKVVNTLRTQAKIEVYIPIPEAPADNSTASSPRP